MGYHNLRLSGAMAAVIVTVLLALVVTSVCAVDELTREDLNERRQQQRVRRQAGITRGRENLFTETRLEQLDMVFALERSTLGDNSKQNFYLLQRPFVRNFLRDFVYVKPDRTRVALMTYGRDVSVAFDGISTNHAFAKCDLVQDDRWWDRVLFVDGDPARGANLTAVFRKTTDILFKGRQNRANSRSLLVLLTSGASSTQEFDRAAIGARDWFDTYAVGISDNVDHGRLAEVARNAHTEVYGRWNEWQRTMVEQVELKHVLVEDMPDWNPYNNPPVCQCPTGSQCFCDSRTGFTRCSCPQGYIDQSGQCVRPCDQSPCRGSIYKCTDVGVHYTCACNTSATGCDTIRLSECRQGSCLNAGTCVDGRDQHACRCKWGFSGMRCEINDNECRLPNACDGGLVCTDQVNSYSCNLPGSPAPTPRPPVTATPGPPTILPPQPPPSTRHPGDSIPRSTQGVPKSTPSARTILTTLIPAFGRSTTMSSQAVVKTENRGFVDNLSNRDRLMLIIIPPAAIALLVLIMSIGAIIYVVRNRRHDQKQRDLSAITDTTSVLSQNPSLMTFDSKCYKDEGTPGPPKISKAEEANRMSYGEFDDVLYGNEALQRGMEEWYSYVLELYHNQGLSRVLIVRLDGEKWVLSPGSKLCMPEIESVYNILSKKVTSAAFNIQGREFGIVGNSDFVIMAHTFRNSKRAQEIACATKTRQYVIVGTAYFAGDNGSCKEKVLKLRDHIKEQGL